jgi:hypothetical protein
MIVVGYHLFFYPPPPPPTVLGQFLYRYSIVAFRPVAMRMQVSFIPTIALRLMKQHVMLCYMGGVEL